jgi:hypothetical protein
MRAPLLALLPLLVGCGHAPNVRWSESARNVCTPRECYRVGSLDASWQKVHREGTAVGFYSDQIGGVIAADVTCRDDGDATPLATLTRHLLIGYTERQVREQRTLPFAGREALHTVVAAKLDGVPVMLDLYVLRRDGCIFDLSFAAPTERFAGGRSAFASFVAGFRPEGAS